MAGPREESKLLSLAGEDMDKVPHRVAGKGAEEEGQRDAEEQRQPPGLLGEGPALVCSGKGFRLMVSFEFSFLIESPICELQSIL